MPWGPDRPYPLIIMVPADPQDRSPLPAGVISDAGNDPVRPAGPTARDRLVDAACFLLAVGLTVLALGDGLAQRRRTHPVADRHPTAHRPPQQHRRRRPATARHHRAASAQRTRTRVAIAVGRGKSNAEIAGELFMSVATVKAHISRILTKLDLNNRTQVALLAHDADLTG